MPITIKADNPKNKYENFENQILHRKASKLISPIMAQQRNGKNNSYPNAFNFLSASPMPRYRKNQTMSTGKLPQAKTQINQINDFIKALRGLLKSKVNARILIPFIQEHMVNR